MIILFLLPGGRDGLKKGCDQLSEAKRRTDLVAIQFPRHFDIIDGSIMCVKFEPIDWIAILLLYSASPPWMT